MRRLSDFLCPGCSKITERFIDEEVTTIHCEICGGTAIRVKVQKPGYRTDHTVN